VVGRDVLGSVVGQDGLDVVHDGRIPLDPHLELLHVYIYNIYQYIYMYMHLVHVADLVGESALVVQVALREGALHHVVVRVEVHVFVVVTRVVAAVGVRVVSVHRPLLAVRVVHVAGAAANRQIANAVVAVREGGVAGVARDGRRGRREIGVVAGDSSEGLLGDVVEQCGQLLLRHGVVVRHVVHVEDEVNLIVHCASIDHIIYIVKVL
jgi:hypothetical protein